MALKDMLENIKKQTVEYIESTNVKEKVISVKDKAIDKIKGIDNPEHYTAPNGFNLFTEPVNTLIGEQRIEELKKFLEKNESDMLEIFSRVISLLTENETILNIIVASMKRTFLVVHTNKDRILVVHKECYKMFNREEVKTFKFQSTGISGLTFALNEYQFVGKEKSKTYTFIRKYCCETTADYSFIPYDSIKDSLNYYERFKYNILNKENQAELENKMLAKLLADDEYPLISIFGTCNNKYILLLSTHYKFYLIDDKQYTVIDRSKIYNFKLTNKGVFGSEFYIDNYYFTNVGPEDSLVKLIGSMNDINVFESLKTEFFEKNKVLLSFPFEGATAYQGLSGASIIIDEKKEKFLLCQDLSKIEMFDRSSFSYYELEKVEDIKKGEMWSQGVGVTVEQELVTKEEALNDYDNILLKIYLKDEVNPRVELPLSFVKKTIYNITEQTYPNSKEVIISLFEDLEKLKGVENEN